MARRADQSAMLQKAFKHALANAVAQAEMALAQAPGNEQHYLNADFKLPDGTTLGVSLSVYVHHSNRNARGELLLKGPGRE